MILSTQTPMPSIHTKHSTNGDETNPETLRKIELREQKKRDTLDTMTDVQKKKFQELLGSVPGLSSNNQTSLDESDMRGREAAKMEAIRQTLNTERQQNVETAENRTEKQRQRKNAERFRFSTDAHHAEAPVHAPEPAAPTGPVMVSGRAHLLYDTLITAGVGAAGIGAYYASLGNNIWLPQVLEQLPYLRTATDAIASAGASAGTSLSALAEQIGLPAGLNWLAGATVPYTTWQPLSLLATSASPWLATSLTGAAVALPALALIGKLKNWITGNKTPHSFFGNVWEGIKLPTDILSGIGSGIKKGAKSLVGGIFGHGHGEHGHEGIITKAIKTPFRLAYNLATGKNLARLTLASGAGATIAAYLGSSAVAAGAIGAVPVVLGGALGGALTLVAAGGIYYLVRTAFGAGGGGAAATHGNGHGPAGH
jgi:hypothetical protein